MGSFTAALVQRLNASQVTVTQTVTYWKPVLFCVSEDGPVTYTGRKRTKGYIPGQPNCLEFDDYFVGRAVNQYFIQHRIAETANSTVWRVYDIIKRQFFCVKLYYISACRKERSVRFFRNDTEVITMLDKAIDEILYHTSLHACAGVPNVNEVIVDLERDMMFFIMDFYPSQLMYYDHDTNTYLTPIPGCPPFRYLYTEAVAKKVLAQLVHTLQYLHENGIVHKDIKPDNILMARVHPAMFDFVDPRNGMHCVRGQSFHHEEEVAQPDEAGGAFRDVVSQMPELGPTEILGFRTSEISGCLPLHMETIGFPYNFSDEFDFFFSAWDNAEYVIDINCFEFAEAEYKLGGNALLVATALAKKAVAASTSLVDFFLGEEQAVPYNVNRNFASVDESAQEPATHEDAGHPMVLVTDFGVASVGEMLADKLAIFDSEGTISFTSPESLKYVDGAIPGPERDVFALGVTLYCMIYGKLPYAGSDAIEMLINILETPLVFHRYRNVSKNLESLLARMLHKDPDKRITLAEIMSHPWLSQ